MQETYSRIDNAIQNGCIDEAQTLINEALTQCSEGNATLHYLHGQTFMKQSNWGAAISAFLKAEAIDPTSPAKEAREMLTNIMAFYHKDSYNP